MVAFECGHVKQKSCCCGLFYHPGSGCVGFIITFITPLFQFWIYFQKYLFFPTIWYQRHNVLPMYCSNILEIREILYLRTFLTVIIIMISKSSLNEENQWKLFVFTKFHAFKQFVISIFRFRFASCSEHAIPRQKLKWNIWIIGYKYMRQFLL